MAINVSVQQYNGELLPDIICKFVCMVITSSKSMDQLGKVNPARGQLNREN